MKFWLVKQEPAKYSWEKLVEDKETHWDGVRNYQARNNLQAMKKGDVVLFYHSVTGKEVVGVAAVSRESYQDPTSDDPRWLAVNLKPVRKLNCPVSLDMIKRQAGLHNIALIKQSRLSVSPLTRDEFKIILALGKTPLEGI